MKKKIHRRDAISDTSTLSPHESLLQDMTLQALDEILSTLTDREKSVKT